MTLATAVWTFDHVIEVVTAAAAVGAVVASVFYGRRGIDATKAATTRESERFAKASRPRVSVTLTGTWKGTVINSGGAAQPACIIVCNTNGNYWGTVTDLPAHQPAAPIQFRTRLIGIKGTPGETTLVAACDSQGVWWNQQLEQPVDGPKGDEDILAWWCRIVFPHSLHKARPPSVTALSTLDDRRPLCLVFTGNGCTHAWLSRETTRLELRRVLVGPAEVGLSPDCVDTPRCGRDGPGLKPLLRYDRT